MATHESQMPFIKNLASSGQSHSSPILKQNKKSLTASDRKLRTASLDSLKLFLSTRKALTNTEALKLWKGLYYALYMTDRPAPQQRLASDLALLANALPRKDAVAVWFDAFWQVLGERWPHIDALRMDKFLLLVRRVFAAQLKHGKDNEAVRAVFADWPFEESGDLRKVPLGLRLHSLDLWVDELEKAGLLEDEGATELVEKVGLMVQALIHCPIKAARGKARDSYEDGRLPWGTKEDADEKMDEDEEWGGIDDE